jgi:mannose-1-phosphate guanylyltransferase/mannose-6-phosphate isomerase
LERLKPDIFANGGDRKIQADIPEVALCKKYGIKMVFGVGQGGKVQSSSWLTGKLAGKSIIDIRPWGFEEVLKVDPKHWIKILSVAPGQRFSLQKHRHRSETWVCVSGKLTAEIQGKKHPLTAGDVVTVKNGQTHRLSSKMGGVIVEVAAGNRVVEDDVIRLHDDYGRN